MNAVQYQVFRKQLPNRDRTERLAWLNELGQDGWQVISVEGLWDGPTTLNPYNVFWGFEVTALRRIESYPDAPTPDPSSVYRQLFTWIGPDGERYAAFYETSDDGLNHLRALGIGSFTQQKVRLLR